MKKITDGASALEKTYKGVEYLNGELSKVEEVVGSISTIAKQTNLLALNAAIEVARAGEAGRGFAVVADEVRKLAEESKTITSRIVATIRKLVEDIKKVGVELEGSTKSVQEVKQLSGEIFSVFSGISERVREISNNLQSVAALSEEQSASSEEINSGINVFRSLLGSMEELVSRLKAMAGSFEHSERQFESFSDYLNQTARTLRAQVEKYRF